MDIFTRAFKDTKTTALTLGVSTVVITHIAIFTLPDPLDKAAKASHAAINLAAAGAIIWGTGMLG
jgi:hypothetical protein